MVLLACGLPLNGTGLRLHNAAACSEPHYYRGLAAFLAA
jgi:hypothetical protein